MTDALEAVLADAGVLSAVFLGFSFGGVVAQVFAQRYPERVDALIVYACIAPFDQPPVVPPLLVAPTVAAMFGAKRWATIREEFAAACALTPAARWHVAAAMAPLGKRGFMAMTRALLGSFARVSGGRYTGPMLIVLGSADSNRAMLDTAAAGLLVAHPQARQATLAAAGHCAHLDAPQAFTAVLDGFLADLVPSSDRVDI